MTRTADDGFGTGIARRIAWALGVVAGLAVLVTLGDPGITIDEPLEVKPGRTYVQTLFDQPSRFFDPDVVTFVYRDNSDHPPLGRWLLGVASILGEPFEPILGGPDAFGVHAARLAPMLAFAVLVGTIAGTTARRFGPASGVVAGGSLLLMPRVFAHAHFAALDTFLALFWTLALLKADRVMDRPRPILALTGAGVWWGLALLTKIHAWLLPPIVLVWAFLRLPRRQALAGFVTWTATGLVVFVAGWPWLWYDTLTRWRDYLGTSVERISLYVQYFGQVYADRDLPWHYPWFYFAVTVPVGLQVLGIVGVVDAWRHRHEDRWPLLLIGAIGVFLVLFSTNVPVYDGDRLILVTFPLWAILIGRGFGAVWRWVGPRRGLQAVVIVAVLAQGYGVVTTHPFGLSYYNLLVGGLPGAQRMGLELTYWGDAVDRVLLDELARRAEPGQVAALVPTLHHVQAPAFLTEPLLRREIALRDEAEAPQADWLVVYRRTAYWRPEIRALVEGGPPVALRLRQGVWLSGLWPVSKPAAAP